MPDNQRIEDLRRRIQKDPASIAFAQLAEEHRRAGQIRESIDVCRTGLAIHPGYLSARVTLGRALLEIDRLDDAQSELELVLKSAPDNLAALRALAEIHRRRDSLPEQYPTMLSVARQDPEADPAIRQLAEGTPTASVSMLSAAAGAGAEALARKTLDALEHFLNGIHVARADRRA